MNEATKAALIKVVKEIGLEIAAIVGQKLINLKDEIEKTKAIETK